MNGYLLFLILTATTASAQTRIPLVGFFRESDSEEELAFRLTVERVNKDKTVLQNVTVDPVIEHVSTFDSFNISKRICALAKVGRVAGILSPRSPETAGAVNSLSGIMAVPALHRHWDISPMPTTYSVNLFPHPKVYAQALVHVIKSLDWKTFAIVYEHSEALIRLQEVIKANNKITPDGHVPFTVWQLDEDPDHRPLLKEIQRSNQMHILLDCSTERILQILHQAKEVGLLSDYHNYVLTSLDAHTLDYREFLSGSVNITTLRLIDPSRHVVQAAVHDWNYEEARRGRRLNLTPETVSAQASLIHDSVLLYAHALNAHALYIKNHELHCDRVNSTMPLGFDIITSMKGREIEGMTGKIRLDYVTGRRTYFTLEVIELVKRSFRKIGSWDPVNGMHNTRTMREIEQETMMAISNKTFKVTSKLGEPYLKEREGVDLKGNNRYEGFSMDLIDDIAKQLGFKYEFYIVEDNQYGKYNKQTKQWNGLIKELRERVFHPPSSTIIF